LKLALPYITRIDKDGYKIIRIFDHYLGEGGDSAEFLYKSDKDCKIEGRYYDKIKGNLKKVFEYWQRERYYD